MTSKTKKDQWTGIYAHGTGWRVVVSRGYGQAPVRRLFAKDTPPRIMQAWRADTQATLRLASKGRAKIGTFEADAKRYLISVKALPTIKDRKREIALWVAIFGRRRRDDITSADIRAQRDLWMTSGRSALDGRPPADNTINKRLRALSNLWTVLDGPKAPNPVRDVPEIEEDTPRPRALDFETIAKVIDAMPDVGQAKKGKERPDGSQSKARLRVLAYTGWSNSMLASLTPDDVNLEDGVARLPRRQKGKGAEAIFVPLVPEAVEALKEFARLNCWGKFSRRSLLTCWNRAMLRLGLPARRVYDLRHSFGTALLTASKDEGAAQDLLQHADPRTTRGYTQQSVPPRLLAARDALAKHLKSRDEQSG